MNTQLPRGSRKRARAVAQISLFVYDTTKWFIKDSLLRMKWLLLKSLGWAFWKSCQMLLLVEYTECRGKCYVLTTSIVRSKIAAVPLRYITRQYLHELHNTCKIDVCLIWIGHVNYAAWLVKYWPHNHLSFVNSVVALQWRLLHHRSGESNRLKW